MSRVERVAPKSQIRSRGHQNASGSLLHILQAILHLYCTSTKPGGVESHSSTEKHEGATISADTEDQEDPLTL
jgi:hypothetical protein